METLELIDKRELIKKDADNLLNTVQTEGRKLNDDEMKQFEEYRNQIAELDKQIEQIKLDNENRTINSNNKTVNKMEKKFSLVKELRSAAETGKKIDFAQIEARGYSVTDEGEDVVVTDIWNPWESLYTKNQLAAAGARMITGIKNNVQIPLMGKATVGFSTELGAAQNGSGTITHKSLSPKRITAYYPISLQLLAQDSIGVESAIRNEIAKALADKVEATVLGNAAGDATKPEGIFYGATIAEVETFGDITALEESVEEKGVDLNACKYIVSPSAKATFRNMPKSEKHTQLVMEGNEIDGTSALCTAHVPSTHFVYGDFSNLVVATWDNVTIDVIRDSQNLINGQVMIVVNAFVDAELVRPDGLAFGKIKTA